MDAIATAAVQFVKHAFEGGVSDAPSDAVPDNAQDAAFKEMVAALRAAGHIPAYGADTDAWVRGQ
jgi:hypothetical protein